MGKRLGIHHKTVAQMGRTLAKTAGIDAYAERIAAMIEADPARSTDRLWAEFKEKEGFDVAYRGSPASSRRWGFARSFVSTLAEW
ncbi:hypothetical protein [Bradyrhizobium iriomotense]|uniref:Transposase n=1 Tax=Bradyrhizobium iriomotense TaxID=441950 RepID=A0ABQ6BEA0_9BRAD|nr:hypothetical protein [Bradyrhizobium iriomotense]GLR92103.1 hypothetical protein GCM10007857_88220 [Bradyrhizobium iriomotense]